MHWLFCRYWVKGYYYFHFMDEEMEVWRWLRDLLKDMDLICNIAKSSCCNLQPWWTWVLCFLLSLELLNIDSNAYYLLKGHFPHISYTKLVLGWQSERNIKIYLWLEKREVVLITYNEIDNHLRVFLLHPKMITGTILYKWLVAVQRSHLEFHF